MKIFSVFISTLAIIITITGYSTGQDKQYKIGDQGPAGGWIFYDKGNNENGWRFLEAAPVDQSKGCSWNNKKDIVTGASGADIGTGRLNTEKIIRVQGPGIYAAKLCADYRGGGKDDWFLPSKDELNLMYLNLHKKSIGKFSQWSYWSSTEDMPFLAVHQNFSSGTQSFFGKSNGFVLVRAIRAF